MQTLHIKLQLAEEDFVELRYWHENQADLFESQRLPLADIQQLLETSEQDYYVLRPNLKAMGQTLFNWLDEAGRWLSRAMQKCPPEGLVLAIAASDRLGNLPWEVLHDGTAFLVERTVTPVVPLRWVKEPVGDLPVRESGLSVLFMATSPEGVMPVLDYEREEAEILRITDELPLQLRVEESGCVKQLGKFWQKFKAGTFDVFHLTGHANIRDNTPYFVTEALTGEPLETTVGELVGAFEGRLPRLAFLSGCKTGQGGYEGEVPSMAEALVRQGVPAVLGWGRPVGDVAATNAAGHLYERLSAGDSIAEAVGSTYRFMRSENISDWHLLRLVARSEAWGPLTEAPGDYIPAFEVAQERFLDPKTQQVRVATAESFVGRRRLLQRSLQHLSGRGWALLLHGLGGVGKSTIAARLLERLQPMGYEPVVIYRHLDEPQLLRRLADHQSEQGKEILQSDLPLGQRLAHFLARGLADKGRKLCFILDDFEANIKLCSDGKPVLLPEAVEPLMALFQGIKQSKQPHRLIVTSRYDVTLPQFDRDLQREELAALRGAELEKKCQRLAAFGRESAVADDLQAQARTAADGNPRLLEWLDKVLVAEGVETEVILTRMAAEEDRFREEILAASLLEQQGDAFRRFLGRGLVFQLPVPEPVMAAVGKAISGWQDCQQRAIALGLMEVSQARGERQLRVPQLLQPLLSAVEDAELLAGAAETLHRVWWVEAEGWTEERALEMLRLAELAGKEEITVQVGDALASVRRDRGRYREAIPLLERSLAISEARLGPEHPDTATSLNNLASPVRVNR